MQPARVVIEEPPLEENINRLQLEGEVAQSVEEAISVLRLVFTIFIYKLFILCISQKLKYMLYNIIIIIIKK